MIFDINPIFLDLYLEHEDVLVEYYLALCNTCPRMPTVLDYLVRELNLSSLLTIVSVDCRKYSTHCLTNSITQYPKWVRIEQSGHLTAIMNPESLIQALNKYNISENNITLASQMFNDTILQYVEEDVCIPGQVLKLKSNNFYSLINNGTFFIKLYSPSCPSCIVMFAIWKELASELVNETKVCIAEYDCSTGMQICKDLQIARIPSILAKEHNLKNLRTIHRLDRLTSGLLLFGRTAEKARELELQIRTRQVQKEYVCRVEGRFPE